MVYKQDFTSVLDLEIEKLTDASACLEGEIKAREALSDNNKRSSPQNEVDYWVNKKTIGWLKGELTSKKEFLLKLRDKKLNDTSELESEHLEMVTTYDKVLFKANNADLDEHDRLRINYMRDEFLLWMGKPQEEVSKKEASVFFFKGIKMILEECNIKLD